MSEARDAVESLLDERPGVEESLRDILALDRSQESWTFDEVDVDSGTFGELVSRGIVEHVDSEYQLANPNAVAEVLGEEPSSTGQDRLRLSIDFSVPDISARHSVLLVFAVGFLLGLRLLPFQVVFRDGAVVLSGNDPYFYRYWVEFLLERPIQVWQLADIPTPIRQHDVAFVVALWWGAALLGGGAEVAGYVTALYPVVSAGVTALLVYWMTTRIFEDRRAALASVLLLAVIPAHAYRTSLGFGDHHAFDFLVLAVTLAALVGAASRPSTIRSQAVALVVVGVSTSLQVLAWRGGPLLVIPVGGTVILAAALSAQGDRHSWVTASTLTGGLLLGTGLTIGFVLGFDWASRFRLLLLAVTAAVALVTIGVARGLQGRKLNDRQALGYVVGAAAVTSLLLIGAALTLRSEQLRAAVSSLTGPAVAVETLSLFSPDFGLFAGPILFLGFVLFLGVPYAARFAWDGWTERDPSLLAVGTYTWYFFALSVVQVRFTGELAIPLAIVSGAGFVRLASHLDIVRPIREAGPLGLPDSSTVISLLLLFLLVGGIGLVQTPIKQGQLAYSEDQFQTAMEIDSYAAERNLSYPENYVLSSWGENRMYNYFVNGHARSYSFAHEHYEPFISATDTQSAYDRLRDRVGFVVTTDVSGTSPETVQALLHKRLGSGNRTVDGSGHYRAVFVAADGAPKAFRLVRGAILTGQGDPASTVTVKTSVQVGSKTVTYERHVETTADGHWVVRVPYPTAYTANGRTVTASASAVSEGEFAATRKQRAEWNFDSQRGNVAFDSTGGNHGWIRGANWTDGVSGSAVKLDGKADQVVVNESSKDTLDADDGFTVSTWFRTDPQADYRDEHRYPAIISKSPWSNYGSIDGYFVGLARGQLLGVVGDGNTSAVHGPEVTDGEWHRSTLTWNGTHIRLYLDGERVDTARFTGNPNNDAPFSIGAFAARGNYFPGTVDEVSFVNRSMTTAEIQAQYNETAGPLPNE